MCGQVRLQEWMLKGHVLCRDWTMCSEIVTILGSIADKIGRTYYDHFTNTRNFTLMMNIRDIHVSSGTFAESGYDLDMDSVQGDFWA